MKKFRFLPPYQKKGKTTYPETLNKSGVYMIKENNVLVYVGMSGINLYRTLYRHFQAWHHKQQEVITYQSRLNTNKYTVRVILCTQAQAVRLERYLILKNKPRDNDMKYQDYKLNVWDQSVYESYEKTPVTEEVPF